jgi:hypothetical protein
MIALLGGAGCEPKPPVEEPNARTVKIGDLAPKTAQSRQAQFLATVVIDVHAFDLPADNVGKLDDLWETLSAKSLWMTSYDAFRRNSFRVRSGRIEAWQRILDLLAKAGAQKVGVSTLMVNDNDSTDRPILGLPPLAAISFFDEASLPQKVVLGPGPLVLRLRTELVSGMRGVRKLIVYPAYGAPISSGVPRLQEKEREREFTFSSAAFAAQMGKGDLFVLAPTEYTGERLTLGGLVFNKAEPVTFIDPAKREPAKQKPAVRVLIFVCMGIRD